MARRKPYTKVLTENQTREKHVKGMGDVVLKGFQCLNPKCEHYLFVRKDEIKEDFEIKCPSCKFEMKKGKTTKFYDYRLVYTDKDETIETGEFSILHDDYINEALEYKYCIVCNTIKPLTYFDNHSARKSGRQTECRLCKSIYNEIKNKTRITEQHIEASQKRRLYLDLSGGEKINREEVFKRFNEQCFKCGKTLKQADTTKEANLDHTLPVFYLWPLTTDNATLLCRDHNSEKSGKWPSEYYTNQEIRRLVVITGIDYQTLSGEPFFNPEAIEKLKDSKVVDDLLEKFGAYLNEIIKLRNRLKYYEGFDFFEYSDMISKVHVEKADEEFDTTYDKK